MTRGLRRLHHSGQSHFITVSCYEREQRFDSPAPRDLFLLSLEAMRRKFVVFVYGYVVMPEHVHLLLSEPKVKVLDDAMHWLKLAFAKRWKSLQRTDGVAPLALAPTMASTEEEGRERGISPGRFWQKRSFDRNVRDAREFSNELDYIHLNPVKRGLVKEPQEWKWSSYRHYSLREIGPVEIESEWTARDREAKITGQKRTFLPPPSSDPP
jgi:putative transposase